MRPKQYLFEQGFIDDPNQRGRLSLENKERIAEAVRNGIHIDGYEVVKGKTAKVENVSLPNETTAPVEVTRVDPDRIYDVPNVTRDEKVMECYAYHNGNKVTDFGMRDICAVCGSSFTYCYCRAPQITRQGTNLMVLFTTRTKPLPVTPWS